MTQGEWLACTNLQLMLDFVADKTSNRKLRLFACACVRQVWPLLADDRSRNAVVMAERFVDGLATRVEMQTAANAAKEAAQALADVQVATSARASATLTPAAKAAAADRAARLNAHWAASWTVVGAGKVAAWAAAKNSERSGQPALLREIIGDPFAPPIGPTAWSPTVLMLADGLYAGQQGTAALHALLLKAGHGELAEHFRLPGQSHPKGCWALDLILGKS